MSPLKKLIVELLVIILLIAGGVGYKTFSDSVNHIFPVNTDEIKYVFVSKQHYVSGSWSSSSLTGENKESFLAALDKLEPVRDVKPRELATTERTDTDYLVVLIYGDDASLFYRNDHIYLYFQPDGRIVGAAANEGYEYYDEHSAYYQEFLALLPEYEKLCVDENF